MSLSRSALLILPVAWAGLLFAGCRTVSTPQSTAAEYARALEEGRVDDAWALTAHAPQNGALSHKAFADRYQQPQQRQARAKAVKNAAPTLSARSGKLTLVREGEQWKVVEPSSEDGPKKALEAFLTAAEKGDFAVAYQWLAAPLRARYTPERLKQDFQAEPQAKERLARARAALGNEPMFTGDDTARFPIGEGRAVTLVLEPDGYRVAALE